MTENVSRETESFTPAVAAQIGMVRAGRRKHVFHGGALCSRCYSRAPAKEQRYCARCRSDYIKAWRKT